MIELTVKTLDSQNHAFSVPDDTTVKQLKERIAESISFPVESQRLIYCGRVLQDEKNLSEYDVNGKVIHLVQRPPPQATRGNGGQQRSGNSQSGRRGNHHFRQSRLDGNAMYLGAMAFPADLMDANGIQAPPSSHSLSDSRLSLARSMLRRATVVLNRLENPTTTETSDPDTPPDEPQDTGSSAAVGTVPGASTATSTATSTARAANGPSSSGGDTGGSLPNLQNLEEGLQQGLPLSRAAQAATAAAIAAAVSAAHAVGVPNITIVRSGQSGPDVVDVRMEDDDDDDGDGDGDGAAAPESSSQGSSQETNPLSSTPESQVQEAADANVEGTESGIAPPPPPANGQSSASRDVPPRTTVLADLMDELNRVNQRLQPFMQHYHSLMREYPNPENNTSTQESQRVFSSVSEIMHFLSHAYHALSDIMCDFSQPPPRALRCRPVLIQHSAVLQAGIPIQAQINVMTNRNNPNNNNNISTNNNGANAPVGTPQEIPQTTSPAAVPEPAEPVLENNRNTASQDEAPAPGNQEEGRNRETRDNQESAFNITPGNVEFFMEVGPGSITIDSLEATVVTNSGSIGGDSIQANVVGGSFPWGAPPPPEFIQNLMQAVAGHMIGRGGTAPNNTTTSSGGSGASTGTAVSGQNSQARGNTATHPTTATQTRSTSRPHVHLGPATMQGLGSSSFDPFLPCNSHHVRSRARQNAQSFTQQLAAAVGATAVDAAGVSGDEETTTAFIAAPRLVSESQPIRNAADGQPSDQSNNSQNTSGSAAATPQTRSSNSNQQQSTPDTQSQSTPNAQSSSSQNTAQGPHHQTISSLLNTLSNIFGHMPAGGGATAVNLSNFFQPMMAQQRSGSQAGNAQPASSQSSGSQTSQTSGASNQSGAAPGTTAHQFPSGMAFFNFSSPPCFSAPPRSQPQNSNSTPRTTRTQQQSQQQDQPQPQPEPSFFLRTGNQAREPQDAFFSPMLAQLFQGIQNVNGSELFNVGNIEGNLADFLMTEGREYHPGTSLIVDLLVTMARNMSLVDIMNISFANYEFLNRIRQQMRQFLLESAFENRPVTSESTAQVVERLVQEIRPHLEIMQRARLREDVDLVTTTIRYNQIRLPELISLIVEGNEVNFGQNMVRWFTRYLRELSAIVLHCCLDGEQGLNKILRDYVVELTSGTHPALQGWTIDSCVTHMQSYMRRQNVPFDEIREYLVYRVPPHPSDSTTHQSSFSSNNPSNVKTDHSSTPTPEPMDTDLSPAVGGSEVGMQEESSASERDSATPTGDVLIGTTSPDMPSPVRMQTAAAETVTAPVAVLGATPRVEVNAPTREIAPGKREPESPLPAMTMDGEPLPDVVLGSEAWHNVLPSEWVPIIARDSQRQRRQNSQAPFSDAYLSGMPSKRRKVVASTKPQGNLNQIITESMRSALDEAGVRPVTGVETAGEDLELQAAYREQVRSAVQDSLSNNPDFTPERFPNASKYFSK